MKINQKGSPVIERWLWIFLFILLAFISLISYRRFFGHDEFEAIHTAWKILTGERIYIDFFQHHHPFYYYAIAPLISIFGESSSSVIVLRMLSFTMFLSMLFITWRISKRLYNESFASLISVILLASSFIFTDSAIEIRPDVPQALLVLLSFASILSFFDNRSKPHLILSAVLLGASFLFLQKSIFAIAIMGLLLLVSLIKKQIKWSDIIIYAAAGILTVLPYLIYLFATDNIQTYYTFNWLINMKFLNTFSAVNGLGVILRTSLVLLVFYIIGMIFFAKTPSQIRISYISIGFLASTFLVRAPYNQYFLPAIPFMAIIAGNALYQTLKKCDKNLASALVISVSISFFYALRKLYYDKHTMLKIVLPLLILSAIVTAITFYFDSQKRKKWLDFALVIALVIPSAMLVNTNKSNNVTQLALVDYTVEITDPDDYVYDGDASFNLFRKDLDYFWFSVRDDRHRPGALMTYQQEIADYHYDIYELIEKYKPKVIRLYQVDDPSNPIISENYTMSEDFNLLYLRNK